MIMKVMPAWKNAPIAEAIIDLRTALPSTATVERLADFQKQIEAAYPIKQPLASIQFGFESQHGSHTVVQEPTAGIFGYRFQSENKRKVIQVQQQGFTFSLLKPYSNWDDFVKEAQTLWRHYQDIADPQAVIRLGLRYINRISIPMVETGVDIKEYLLTAPDVAPGAPQGLLTYFMRLVLASDDRSATANVIQSLDQYVPGSNTISLVFDIDVSRDQISYDPMSSDIWDDFAKLRAFKNQILYNSLTDKARRLFE